MQQKIWQMKEQAAETVEDLCAALSLLPVTARLLINRGYASAGLADAFLRKETGHFYDPFLMKDMGAAADRILRAVARDEKITIYGDYDVDGVTATTIVYQYLASRGANVHFFIPGRIEDGYGLNSDAIRRIAADGTTLLITVDTGITAIEEAALAKTLGISLVITDHHTCRPQLPEADAVIDPKREDETYPFRELAGVGVAFKLLCALETADCRDDAAQKRERLKTIHMAYAEYTAIGTIADVMPLRDENRLIVYLGLMLLQETKRPGLRALLACSSGVAPSENKAKYPTKRRKFTAGYIGYTLAPRINAAGRIARADRAVALFLTEREEEAATLAEELCEENRIRQDMENAMTEAAFAQVVAEHDVKNEHILILSGEHWHHGVIGIVASRVTEKYHRPALLISFEGGTGGAEDIGKGSGRSIEGFDLIAGITACGAYLVTFGGHALAAGLSITRKNLPAFCAAMETAARAAFCDGIPPQILTLDCEMQFSDITLPAAEQLYALEPYGVGNPTPLFYLHGARILQISALSGGKHTKLRLCAAEDPDGIVTREALWFGVRTETIPYRTGDVVDAAFHMDVNEFMGQKQVQMLLQDLRFSDAAAGQYTAQMRIYAQVRRKTAVCLPMLASPAEMIPTRAMCAAVYTILREKTEHGRKSLLCPIHTLCYHTGYDGCRLRFILDIFTEAALLTYMLDDDDMLDLMLLQNTGEKKDLTETPTMRLLLELYS